VVSEPVVIPASLNDVDFSSPKTGWITTDKGDSGQILGTTDSGRSWRSDWAGSGVVGQVDSGGSGHVWALVQAGSNCDGAPADSTCVSNLLASSNAGRSWTYRGTFPADNAVQIAFSKTSLGLAAGISRCVDQESDTGKTSYPPSACRGSVLLSTDGGRRWKTSLKTPGPVFAVAQSPRTLWAVEAPLGGFVGADGSGRISIIRSQNRGQSWSTVGSLPAMLVTPALNAKLIVGTRGRLWLSLSGFDDCDLQGCGAAVWLSQDGGRQWTNDTPSSTAQCNDSAPASILSDDPAGDVWDSFDAGSPACGGPASVLNLASGSPPTTWHPVLSWSQFSPMAMSWPSTAVGYAVSTTSVLRTGDRGAHWSQVLPSAAPTLSVDALSAKVAFGAGEAAFGGAVSETSDGGQTWKVQGRVPGTVTSVDFINSQRGYAAATNSATETWRLYATSNGGASWVQVGPVEYTAAATPGPAGYTAGQVFGPWINRDGQGVLVGALYATAAQAAVASPSAYVWHTDDGGAQWTEGAPLDVGAPLDTVLAASFLPSNLDQGIVSFVEGPKAVQLESTSDGVPTGPNSRLPCNWNP